MKMKNAWTSLWRSIYKAACYLVFIWKKISLDTWLSERGPSLPTFTIPLYWQGTAWSAMLCHGTILLSTCLEIAPTNLHPFVIWTLTSIEYEYRWILTGRYSALFLVFGTSGWLARVTTKGSNYWLNTYIALRRTTVALWTACKMHAKMLASYSVLYNNTYRMCQQFSSDLWQHFPWLSRYRRLKRSCPFPSSRDTLVQLAPG